MSNSNLSKIEFIVDEQGSFTRLDKLLCLRMPQFTRNKLVTMIESGSVTVNGKNVLKNYKTRLGDKICVEIVKAREFEAHAENIPLDVAYEDGDIIVINKPKGMVVHPAHGNESGTLVNALLYHCKNSLSGINGIIRPGIVHRIDKDTSGLIVAAKNDFTHNSLALQFKEHTITREYRAIVYGVLKEDKGEVCKPVGRHRTERKKMSCNTNAVNPKRAVTHFEVIERYNGFTYIKCRLETGRTHQIRVHMSDMGHFIIGDSVYGRKVPKINIDFDGQCLHAKNLGFVHPSTGQYMLFDSELPDYFETTLNKIRGL